jgi:hypothetical protein
MVEKVKKYQLNLKQNVNRMQDSRLPKLAYLYKPEAQRNVGRPKVGIKTNFKHSEFRNGLVAPILVGRKRRRRLLLLLLLLCNGLRLLSQHVNK